MNTSMPFGLTVAISEWDEDYVTVDVIAATERFSGATLIYLPHAGLARLANSLDGFPQSRSDVRRIELGERDLSRPPSGYCCLRFHCLDGSGRAAVDVEIRDSEFHYEAASAQFRIAFFVGSSMDSFVARLRQAEGGGAVEARLQLWEG